MTNPVNRSKDKDLRNAEVAMKRAALKAREKAKQFDHGIAVIENGKVVELKLND